MFLAAENWKELPSAEEAVRVRKARESQLFLHCSPCRSCQHSLFGKQAVSKHAGLCLCYIMHSLLLRLSHQTMVADHQRVLMCMHKTVLPWSSIGAASPACAHRAPMLLQSNKAQLWVQVGPQQRQMPWAMTR